MCKDLEYEEKFTIFYSFDFSREEANTKLIDSLEPNDYVTCIYGEYWWLALVNEVNREEKDVHYKFMHPHGYTENFYWPIKDDENYVPFSKILLKVNTPNTLSQSGMSSVFFLFYFESNAYVMKLSCNKIL